MSSDKYLISCAYTSYHYLTIITGHHTLTLHSGSCKILTSLIQKNLKPQWKSDCCSTSIHVVQAGQILMSAGNSDKECSVDQLGCV